IAQDNWTQLNTSLRAHGSWLLRSPLIEVIPFFHTIWEISRSFPNKARAFDACGLLDSSKNRSWLLRNDSRSLCFMAHLSLAFISATIGHLPGSSNCRWHSNEGAGGERGSGFSATGMRPTIRSNSRFPSDSA